MTTPTAIYKKDYIKMASRLSFSTGEFNAPAHEVGRRNEFDSRLKSFGCPLPFWAAESHVSNTQYSADDVNSAADGALTRLVIAP